MQESPSPIPTVILDDTRHAPLHEDIAECARDMWIERGRPADRDLEIWLAAEQRLFSAIPQVSRHKSTGVATSKKQRMEKTERY